MISLILLVSDKCPRCRRMQRKCEVIALSTGAELRIYNVDKSDYGCMYARKFYINSTPAILVKHGKEFVNQAVGEIGLGKLKKIVGI